MNINLMNFIYNLKYMALGMVGIIAVIGAIVIVTMILNKVTSNKKEQ